MMREQLLAILRDLGGERGERVAELVPLVLRGRAGREVRTRGRAREVIVEIDREEIVREQRRGVHGRLSPPASPAKPGRAGAIAAAETC